MKTLTRKLLAITLALTALLSLTSVPLAFAADFSERVVETQDLGNGITVETILTIYPNLARSSSQSASATSTFKNNGSVIGTVTLNATFGYNGTSAWVTSTSYSKTTATGWVYTGNKITTSGSKASLTGTLVSLSYSVPVSISLTCSPTGTITKS